MTRRRRDDDRPIRRQPPWRQPKHRILVVCEGRKTEPLYLKWFQHHVRNPLVHVEINDDAGRPAALVQRAIDLRHEAEAEAKQKGDAFLRFDETWCVFDIDDHPSVEEARRQAKANAITLAISNPCFELWALLHIRDQRAWIDRHAAQREVREVFPGYVKELPFDRLIAGYDEAVARAQRLDERAERDGRSGRNPTTGVYQLTELIRTQGLRPARAP